MKLVSQLKQLISKDRSPGTIRDALLRVIPNQAITVLDGVPDEDLITAVAERVNIASEDLLTKVAALFELPDVSELEPVTNDVRSMVSLDSDLLKRNWCAPQLAVASLQGYAIATARPDLIDTKAFLAQGIPIWLTIGSQIQAAWEIAPSETYSRTVRPEVSIAQAWVTLRKIAAEGSRLGASEVFIGHPAAERYEFIADGKRFVGKIHPGIYTTLLSVCRAGMPLRRKGEPGDEITEIWISLTKNFERPVICLGWMSVAKPKRLVVERAELIERRSRKLEARNGLDVNRTSEQRQRVLFVDDDIRFLQILGRIFESKGWIVSTASSVTQAEELLKGEPIDLIVTDLHMPEIDGAEFLQRIKALGPGMPVLVLTSDDSIETEAELVLLGADAFVRKQEDPRILLSWCKNLARRGAKTSDDVFHCAKREFHDELESNLQVVGR